MMLRLPQIGPGHTSLEIIEDPETGRMSKISVCRTDPDNSQILHSTISQAPSQIYGALQLEYLVEHATTPFSNPPTEIQGPSISSLQSSQAEDNRSVTTADTTQATPTTTPVAEDETPAPIPVTSRRRLTRRRDHIPDTDVDSAILRRRQTDRARTHHRQLVVIENWISRNLQYMIDGKKVRRFTGTIEHQNLHMQPYINAITELGRTRRKTKRSLPAARRWLEAWDDLSRRAQLQDDLTRIAGL